jgi:hypothetical protein
MNGGSEHKQGSEVRTTGQTDQASIQEAIARREAGEALAEIGRSYNVSHSTISRI